MSEKHLYEYAVIRVLPRVEREEFINVGIVLFSKGGRYLKSIHHLDEKKLKLFSTELDIEFLHKHLQAFDALCRGDVDAGPIALLEIQERFRWLTAVRSSSIQTSRPHLGFTCDPEETFQRLFRELVL